MPNHPFMAIGFNTSRSWSEKSPIAGRLDGKRPMNMMNIWISRDFENLYTKKLFKLPSGHFTWPWKMTQSIDEQQKSTATFHGRRILP